MANNCKITFINGDSFEAENISCCREVIGELVFNTQMLGYEQMITNPCYKGKIVLLNYPLIGCYGINGEDYESSGVTIGGLIVKDYADEPSNFRASSTLGAVLTESEVPLLVGLDTRELSTYIRENGEQLAMISDICVSTETIVKKLKDFKEREDILSQVSVKKPLAKKTKNAKYSLGVIDFGVANSLVNAFINSGANLTILPPCVSCDQVLAYNFDGLILSGGYEQLNEKITAEIRKMLGKLPIFAMGVGCLYLALACNQKISKLLCGHYSANHPSKNLETNVITTISQNHSNIIDESSLGDVKVLCRNVIDRTIEGIEVADKSAFGVMYNIDVLSSPRDAQYLLTKFKALIDLNKSK